MCSHLYLQKGHQYIHTQQVMIYIILLINICLFSESNLRTVLIDILGGFDFWYDIGHVSSNLI